VERRLPPPAAGEVRVAIEAAGVAYADIMMRQGVYAGHKPPITPGYDLVGRVEAGGSRRSGPASRAWPSASGRRGNATRGWKRPVTLRVRAEKPECHN